MTNSADALALTMEWKKTELLLAAIGVLAGITWVAIERSGLKMASAASLAAAEHETAKAKI